MELAVIDAMARWAHIIGVVIWMGHNYANVIQRPVFEPVEPNDPEGTLREHATAAMKREHGIFRHASLVTLATGLFMLWYRDVLVETISLSGDYAVLGIGVWTGTIMVLNLWFVLWPHQKKVLGFVAAPTAERIRCSRVTFLSSRTNTILSVPTIFFMAVGAHGAFLFG
jgi:uncharacterized membrane protein